MHPRTPALTFCLLLCACGGGGGGDGGGSSLPAPTTLTGTVAANTALADHSVAVHSTDSSSAPLVIAGADGRYTITLFRGAIPPFLIGARGFQVQGEPQYPRLSSIATRGGTANVTPLTSLLVARLLNRKPGLDVNIQGAAELQNLSDADLSAAQQQVVAYLLTRPSKDNGNSVSPVDVAVVTDFVTMPLTVTPGDPHFEALRRLHESLMDSETIAGVEEHMLFRNDPPADLAAMLALDFFANCRAEGADDGTAPRGNTRIVVNSLGITFGNVSLPFDASSRLNLTAGLTIDERWRFSFPTQQAGVEFTIGNGRFTDAALSLPPFMGSRCSPVTAVSVSGKHPSLMALVRRLAGTVAPAFQCAAPITFPGFRAGTNFLTFDANGAARINSLGGGPSIHLPSLNIEINATLVADGGLPAFRLTTFSASRAVRDGFDVLNIRPAADGQIIELRLDRINEQSGHSQSCGVI